MQMSRRLQQTTWRRRQRQTAGEALLQGAPLPRKKSLHRRLLQVREIMCLWLIQATQACCGVTCGAEQELDLPEVAAWGD